MKVMIVEDDMLVRLGIKSMIPWKQMGMEIVCEARDGLEAVELFTAYQPNIILVDIGIPKLNGLDFIERVKPADPSCEFIILTCNKDFEMVQRSLRLGVRDFVLKSTMEIEELQATLEKVAQSIREKKVAVSGTVEHLMKNDVDTMKKNVLLRGWLNGVHVNYSLFREKLARCGIATLYPNFQAWVIQLETRIRNGAGLEPADMEKIGYAIENVAGELFREALIGFVPDVRQRRWHVMFHYPGHTGVNPLLLIDAIERYLGFDITIACSELYTKWDHWDVSAPKAEELLELKYYLPEESLFFDQVLSDVLPDSIIERKKEFSLRLSLLQLNDAIACMQSIGSDLKSPFPKPKIMKNMFREMMLEIAQLRERHDPEANSSGMPFREHQTLREELHNISTLVRETGESLFHDRYTLERKQYIEAARHFINDHLFEDVSLNRISEQVSMSPAYFSKLFKLETGQSFTDYVLAAKLDRAEQMMREGKSVTDISEKLGYLNLSSFTRMFKKIKGVAPSHYNSSGS
ncbi:response regulator [Paenibacillus periandrae]|uniref:response regulator transcription factor n=1 Tax=Paenibacillus periandrae TaxID=1761741 RepID=UPI001F09C762|nr:response regulator [Paenibacillus periandrae]